MNVVTVVIHSVNQASHESAYPHLDPRFCPKLSVGSLVSARGTVERVEARKSIAEFIIARARVRQVSAQRGVNWRARHAPSTLVVGLVPFYHELTSRGFYFSFNRVGRSCFEFGINSAQDSRVLQRGTSHF